VVWTSQVASLSHHTCINPYKTGQASGLNG
jgi:hypothetical protein